MKVVLWLMSLAVFCGLLSRLLKSSLLPRPSALPLERQGLRLQMSLGGGKSRALDGAVNKAVESGTHFAVAADNDSKDAGCSYSPAAEKAITVGASNLGDERAYFSLLGLNILST